MAIFVWLALAASAALATAQSTMIFNTSCSVCVYTSAGVTKHATSGTASFAISDGLNQPEFIEVYDSTGTLAYTFSDGSGTYILDTARHDRSNVTTGTVDVFGALLGATSLPTTLFGLASTLTNVPVWTTPLPGCSTDQGVGGTYVGIEAAGDGSAVAYQCVYTDPSSGAVSSRVYYLNGQTGAVAWFWDATATFGVKAGQGQVQITDSGSFVLLVNEQGVPTPNTAEAYIIAADGTLRGNVTIPFFITAAVSDSGNYVVVGNEGSAGVFLWSSSSNSYQPAYTLTPPMGAQGFIPWDIQMSTGSDASELVIIGSISGDVLTVQVTAYGLVTGTQLTNWVSQTNAKLQENPTIRAEGPYIGVSLWGDVSGDAPTIVLLKAGSNTPLFTYNTPGSMFAVDVVIDSSTATQDVVLIAAAGKAVPANVMGNGGNAYAFSVVVPT